MTVLGTAVVKIDVEDKDLNSKFDNAKKKASSFGDTLSSVGKIAAGFLAANVISKGFDAFTTGISKSIDLASDFAESSSKLEVVLGKVLAQDIQEWSQGAAKGMGMSSGAAVEATGTFANFLKAMGQTPAEAAKMSKSMVQLAADMASFNNADPTEVITALRAGLSGEAEPLKRFGVALNETAVKAEAAKLGLKGVNGELTEGEKVQARYSIIMRQTADAQGDFARTADGAANKQRILTASIEDAQRKLGEKLLPLKQAWLDFQLTMLEGMPKIVEGIKDLLGPAFEFLKDLIPDIDFGELLGKVRSFVTDIQSAFEPIKNSFLAGLFGGTQGGSLSTLQEAAFTLGNAIRDTLKPALDDVQPSLDAFMNALKGGTQGGDTSAGQNLGAEWGTTIRETITQIGTAFTELGTITETLAGAFDKIIEKANEWGVLSTVFETVGTIVSGQITAMLKDFESLSKIISGGLTTISGLLSGDWAKAWEGAKTTMSGAVALMTSQFTKLDGLFTELLKQVDDALGTKFEAAWDEAKTAVKDAMSDMVSFIESSGIEEALGKIVSWVGKAASDIVGKVSEIISSIGRANQAANSFSQSGFAGNSGAGGGAGGGGGGAWGPTPQYRAEGGLVRRGQPYITGETGWEPFIPEQNGRIISHEDAMMALSGKGGSTINISNITLPNVQNAQQLLDELQQLQTRELRFAMVGG